MFPLCLEDPVLGRRTCLYLECLAFFDFQDGPGFKLCFSTTNPSTRARCSVGKRPFSQYQHLRVVDLNSLGGLGALNSF